MIAIETSILVTVISYAYAVVGIIGTLAYWPTIRDLLVLKKKSANVASYALWTLSTGIAFLYAIFVVEAFLLTFISGLNFIACFVILILAFKMRK